MAFLGSSLWTKAHDVEMGTGLPERPADPTSNPDPEIRPPISAGTPALAETLFIAAADKGRAIDVSDQGPRLEAFDTPGEA
jgi:hypothetical protein